MPQQDSSEQKESPSAVNFRQMEPLYAPELYYRHFDGGEKSILVPQRGQDQPRQYDFYRRFDDPASSFSGAAFINRETGHAILMYKGMDKPFFDEGSGRTGFMKDAKVALQASSGTDNVQTQAAERAYLDIANDPNVKSMELVGYSIGSLHMNYMAAKHGAVGTNLADMGMPSSVLASQFNEAVAGGGGQTHSQQEIAEAMQNRVTTLTMRADVLPRAFAASAPLGKENILDAQGLNWMGVTHVPMFYAKEAGKIMDESGLEKPAETVPGKTEDLAPVVRPQTFAPGMG